MKKKFSYILIAVDENIKSAIGQTLLAVANQCQEAVQAKSEKIVPVIFFAIHLKKTCMCVVYIINFIVQFMNTAFRYRRICFYHFVSADGTNDAFIDLWNEVWNDVIGSMEVALSKHKSAILIFLRESFNSPSWNSKTQVIKLLFYLHCIFEIIKYVFVNIIYTFQAARALSTFINKCSDDLRDNKELKLLVQDLITTVSGKFWHGKEEVLDTVATLCTNKK